jgi:hypothetical protein
VTTFSGHAYSTVGVTGVDLESLRTGAYSTVCGTQVLVVVVVGAGIVVVENGGAVSSFGEKLEKESRAGLMFVGDAYSLSSDKVLGSFSFLDLSLMEFRVVIVIMVFSEDMAAEEQCIDVGAGGGGPFGRSEYIDLLTGHGDSFLLAVTPTFSFSASVSLRSAPLFSTDTLNEVLPLRSNTLILLRGGFGGALDRRELNFGFSLTVGASILLSMDNVRPPWVRGRRLFEELMISVSLILIICPSSWCPRE